MTLSWDDAGGLGREVTEDGAQTADRAVVSRREPAIAAHATLLYSGPEGPTHAELSECARANVLDIVRTDGRRAALAFARVGRIVLAVIQHGSRIDSREWTRAMRRAGVTAPILGLIPDSAVEAHALLDAGVDDAVALPVASVVLAQRVDALLRHRRGAYALSVEDGIVFRPLEHTVTINGTRHLLSPATHELFSLLAAHPGCWIPVEDALQRLQLRLTGARGARHLKHRLAALRDVLGDEGITLQFSASSGIRLDGAP